MAIDCLEEEIKCKITINKYNLGYLVITNCESEFFQLILKPGNDEYKWSSATEKGDIAKSSEGGGAFDYLQH